MTTILCAMLLATPQQVQPQKWTVGETVRQGLVWQAGKDKPLLLVFHGHGGTAKNIARTTRYHELWPEANVVYLQGLVGVKGVTDPSGSRTGWQKGAGTYDDRDLKFVKVVLDWAAKELGAKPSTTFATGHSNGSQFTWVAGAAYPDRFAALAASCGPSVESASKIAGLPCFVAAGKADPVVPIEGMERFIDSMKSARNVKESEAAKVDGALVYGGKAKLVVWKYDGGHQPPGGLYGRFVGFFKESAPK